MYHVIVLVIVMNYKPMIFCLACRNAHLYFHFAKEVALARLLPALLEQAGPLRSRN